MTVREAVERVDQTPAKPTNREAIRGIVEQQKDAIGASLPSGMSVDRFARLLLTAANTNPDLFSCDPRSFLAAGVFAAQLGLEPNDPRGLAYLIPFNDNNRGTKVVTFIIGYRGMMELARRGGQVTSIHAFPVFEGDRFSYRFGLDPHLDHVPSEDGDDDPRALTHVYAVAKVGGDPQFVILTRKQIDKVKASSKSARSSHSPWNTHYVEMALKTAIRRLCKYLPQTVEMATAIAADERQMTINDLSAIAPIHDDPDVVDVGEIEEAQEVDQ